MYWLRVQRFCVLLNTVCFNVLLYLHNLFVNDEFLRSSTNASDNFPRCICSSGGVVIVTGMGAINSPAVHSTVALLTVYRGCRLVGNIYLPEMQRWCRA